MLEKKTIAILKEILFRFLDPQKDKVFIFGSRAGKNARKFSDIDIGVESTVKIPWAKLAIMKEALEESKLPYTVDVVDFKNVSGKFKEIAGKKIISLN